MTSAAVARNPGPLGGVEGVGEAMRKRDAGAGPPDGTPYAGKRHRISRVVSGPGSHLGRSLCGLCGPSSPLCGPMCWVKSLIQWAVQGVQDFSNSPMRARPRARTLVMKMRNCAQDRLHILQLPHTPHPAYVSGMSRACTGTRTPRTHARASSHSNPFEREGGGWLALVGDTGELL